MQFAPVNPGHPAGDEESESAQYLIVPDPKIQVPGPGAMPLHSRKSCQHGFAMARHLLTRSDGLLFTHIADRALLLGVTQPRSRRRHSGMRREAACKGLCHGWRPLSQF
jgi:hypothetical protein